MRSLDWTRVVIVVAAIGVGAFTLAATRFVFIDVNVAQTLIGTFSVLAGFLVSALAFIQPVQPLTTFDKAVNTEIRKRTVRLSLFFYLYVLNVLVLLAYLIFKEAADKPFGILGKAALAISLFSLVLSLEVPRMVIKLRAYQTEVSS